MRGFLDLRTALIVVVLVLGAFLLVFTKGYRTHQNGSDPSPAGSLPGSSSESGSGSNSSPGSDPNSSARTPSSSRTPSAPQTPSLSSKSDRGTRPISSQLPPRIEIVKGTVEGTNIAGPVVVSGSFESSAIVPVMENGEALTTSFRIVKAENGFMAGPYTIEAASAHSTPTGIKFEGPILLTFENLGGHKYGTYLKGSESWYFISADGQKHLMGGPFPPEDRSPDRK